MGTITRSVLTDDDGSGATGSIINNSEIQKIYDNIDAEVKSATYPSTTTKSVIDTVKNATSVAGLPKPLIVANGVFNGTTITNVSTVVLPVLTALDHLEIKWGVTAGVGLTTGGIQVRHVTDGALLFDGNNSTNLNTGEHAGGFATISQDHIGNTKIDVFGQFQNDAHLSGLTQFRQYASTATWGSAWTLGFALTQTGGSTDWWWSVVLYPGQ